MTLEELAEEYLVTPDGLTPDNPCGAWCNDNAINAWVAIVQRIRGDLLRLARANPGATLPAELQTDVARWLLDSMRVKPVKFWGGFEQAFGGATDVITGLVGFARRGVQLMFETSSALEEAGGTIPSPGPRPAPRDGELDLFPGPDGVWWVGIGVVATLVLLQLWRGR